jgi:hypothetical protein
VPFTWSVPTPCGAAPACSGSATSSGLDTGGTTALPPAPNLQSNAMFSDRLVTISVPISTSYNPSAASGGWWSLNYTFGGNTAFQDLTTWTVSVSGNPVHLVNG